MSAQISRRCFAAQATTLVLGSMILSTFAVAAPAVASDDILEVSPDGVVYTEEFDGFLSDHMLVPLGTATDEIHIRNSSDTNGYLRIVVADVSATDPALAEHAEIGLTAQGQDWGAASLTGHGGCAQVANNIPLGAGQTSVIGAALTLGDLTGADAQNQSMSFRFQLVMSDTPMVDSDSCPVPTPNQPLSTSVVGAPSPLIATGGILPLAALFIAGGLAGVLLALLGRRKRKTDDLQ